MYVSWLAVPSQGSIHLVQTVLITGQLVDARMQMSTSRAGKLPPFDTGAVICLGTVAPLMLTRASWRDGIRNP